MNNGRDRAGEIDRTILIYKKEIVNYLNDSFMMQA